MNKKQWHVWAVILIAAGITLLPVPLAAMLYTGIRDYPFVGLIIGYLCGVAGVACLACEKLEEVEV